MMGITKKMHKIYLKHERVPFYIGDNELHDHYVPIGNDNLCDDFSVYFTNLVPKQGGRLYIDPCYGHLIISNDCESKPIPKDVRFCPFCGETIKLILAE